MYTRKSSRIEEITPRRCEALLGLNTFEGQRPLSRQVAEKYANAMRDGTWLRGEIAIAESPDGTRLLMNGQHQCHAALQAQRTFNAVVDVYQCQSNEDLWHLFAQFDGHRPRTERHVLKAARGLFESESLRNLPCRLLEKCGSALLFLGGNGLKPNFHTVTPSKTMKADLVQKYEVDVLRLGHYTPDLYSKLTIPVVTAMIVTYRVNEAKAREFWDRVLIGDDLKRGSPQWHLSRALNGEVNLTRSQIGTNGRDRSAILYAMCISWWNSYVTGQPRTCVKVSAMKSVPEALGGYRKAG